MWRRPSPIASAMPFRYGASSTPSSCGRGQRLAGHERAGDVGLGVLLLGVLEVAGEPHVGVVGDRVEARRERGAGFPDQLVGAIELAAVDRADRVRARADRAPGGRQRLLAGGDLGVEAVVQVAWLRSSRSTPGRSGAGGRLARAHDHVHPVALAERAEAVEARARPACCGPRPRTAVAGAGRDGAACDLAWRCGAVRIGRLAVLDREEQPDVDGEQRRRRPAVTAHTTRSGGTSPIRNVMPIDSSRKVKTCRRRSRARARLRSVGPDEPHPLARGHDPAALRCRASQPAPRAPSCVRSPRPTPAGSTPASVGSRNATHMMPNAARGNHSTPSLPWGR